MLGRYDWTEPGRRIVFGAEAAQAVLADGAGFALIGTERWMQAEGPLAMVVERAASVHRVGVASVAEEAAALLTLVKEKVVVVVGGGRVIDTAKAVVAGRGYGTVTAIPTTLSGAEMTSLHRHAVGVAEDTTKVRPSLVINDPALCASQSASARAASAANALGHAVEAVATTRANPVSNAVAASSVRLLASAASRDAPAAWAMGALLAGHALDAAGYGIHHVLAQTIARELPVPHAAANAALLPHAVDAVRGRTPDAVATLDAAAGQEVGELAQSFALASHCARLREFGVSPEDLATCARVASERPQLDWMPPRAASDELLAILEAAW